MTSRHPGRTATQVWDRRLQGVGFAVLAIVLVGTLWCTPYLPTNDGPEWVFASHLESHYGDPGTLYRDVFAPALQFACRGFTIILTPLEDVLGWRVGLEAAQSIATLLSALGLATLVHAVEPRRLPLAFLAFPMALTWHFYMGFFAFGMGSALGCFVLAIAVRWTQPTRLQRVGLAFFLFVQGVAHIFSAVLTGGLVLALWVGRAAPGRRASEAAKVALMGLPAAGILAASVLLARGSADMAYDDRLAFAPAKVVLEVLPRTLVPGPEWRALAVTALVTVALAALVRRALGGRLLGTDRALGSCAIAMFLLALFAPMNIPGWQYFSQRFLPLGAALLLVTVPLERLPTGPSRRRAEIALFVLAMGWLLPSYALHRRLFDACRDALAGLDSPVRWHRDWLPVTLAPEGTLPRDPAEREVPFLAPLFHVGALYATVEGGLTPYYFADSAAVAPFVLRPDGPTPPPVPDAKKVFGEIDSSEFLTDRAFRRSVQGHLATLGMFYEGVVVTGATADDLELWTSRGYEASWQAGGTLIARFAPCRLDIAIPATAADPPPTLDDDQVIKAFAVRPVVDRGTAHLVVARGPCGDIWVRPQWPRAEVCGNARKAGQLLGRVSHENGVVVCSSVAGPP